MANHALVLVTKTKISKYTHLIAMDPHFVGTYLRTLFETILQLTNQYDLQKTHRHKAPRRESTLCRKYNSNFLVERSQVVLHIKVLR